MSTTEYEILDRRRATENVTAGSRLEAVAGESAAPRRSPRVTWRLARRRSRRLPHGEPLRLAVAEPHQARRAVRGRCPLRGPVAAVAQRGVVSTILQRWAEHAAEMSDMERRQAAADQLRHLIASDVPLSATAEHSIALVAEMLDPRDSAAEAGLILDQTGPGMFRCVSCGTAVATADVFRHYCSRAAS